MFSHVVCVALLTLSANIIPGQPVFYVAPDGEDSQAGTKEAPFATLERAQEAVRECVQSGLKKPVAVFLRGGVYFLDDTLHFGANDGGTDKCGVAYKAYPGEKPVISGGQVISGWTRAEGNRWTVTLPAVQKGQWHFRQLFVDGKRLPRAAHPNKDELIRIKSVDDSVTQITLEEMPKFLPNNGEAELVVYNNWSICRVGIKARNGNTLTTTAPVGWIGHGHYTTANPGKPVRLENAAAFLDTPGEWYLDRKNGVLTYLARENEDPNTRIFIAPKLEQLVVVHSDSTRAVRNLHFVGITFAHSQWNRPEFGYRGIQAGHYGTTIKEPAHVLPAALQFSHSRGCGLAQCALVHLGASGVTFGAKCERDTLIGCRLDDIGGNGVMVGWRGAGELQRFKHKNTHGLDSDWPDPNDAPRDNVITSNYVYRCGQILHGSVGIFDAFSKGTQITHNEVAHMPYTGISVGFRWNSSETSQANTHVERNHVFDVMKKLADGACIYTLGLQPNATYQANLLHDVHRSTFAHGGAPNNGFFFDEGSKGMHVDQNITYNTSGDPIRFNQTKRENLTWGENYFDVSPDAPNFPKKVAEQAGPHTHFKTIWESPAPAE